MTTIRVPTFDPRWLLRMAVVLVAIWGVFSCFSTVPADSVGVRLRFGKYQDTVQPGLRFILPFGIEQLMLVRVQRQLKMEFGFGTRDASNPDQYSHEQEEEQNMVTGDLNMAMVQWIVQYRIEDAKQFLFHVREPGATLRDATESVMREVVGDRTVDEVLTIGRQEIESETLLRLKQLAQRYGLSVSIMQVQLKDVHPPRPVQASFNEVNQSQQEKEQAINMANVEYNQAVPRARGQAEQAISEAEGYAAQRVNEARGDADKFNAILTEYLKAPEVTRQRLYLETMAAVLPQFERKIILDEKASRLLPLLPLSPLTEKGGAK